MVERFVRSAHSELESLAKPGNVITTEASALETLVRTACETLAVSTVLSGHSSSTNQALDATNQEVSKDFPSKELATMVTEAVVTSPNTGQNVFTTSHASQASTSSAALESNAAVLSVIFEPVRDGSVTGNTIREQMSVSPPKDQQSSALELASNSLSDMGDAEVCVSCQAKFATIKDSKTGIESINPLICQSY